MDDRWLRVMSFDGCFISELSCEEKEGTGSQEVNGTCSKGHTERVITASSENGLTLYGKNENFNYLLRVSTEKKGDDLGRCFCQESWSHGCE